MAVGCLKVSDMGNVLGLLGLASSLFTTIIGIVYTWYHHPTLRLKWSECGWSDTATAKWVDCNSEWAANFGMAQLPSLVPLFVGIFGTFMYRPMLLQVGGFPKNFVQYAAWLLFQGLFANFGYCGKLGVINGWFSIILAISSLIAEVTGLNTDRMLELKGHKLISCGTGFSNPSTKEPEKTGVKDYMPWAIMSAFFCPLLGGYGVYQASQVKAFKKKKDMKAARRASRLTTTWSLYALMLGVVLLGSFTTIYITDGRVAAPPPDAGDDGDDGDDGYGDASDSAGDADTEADGASETTLLPGLAQ